MCKKNFKYKINTLLYIFKVERFIFEELAVKELIIRRILI